MIEKSTFKNWDLTSVGCIIHHDNFLLDGKEFCSVIIMKSFLKLLTFAFCSVIVLLQELIICIQILHPTT